MKDYSSIVVRSKVSLHRNLNGFLFPSMLEGVEGTKVLNKIADTVLTLDDKLKIYKVKTLPELDINVMHEKRLISAKLMDSYGYGAVILSGDENVSIMINESDHLVEECRFGGLTLISAFDQLNAIDNTIMSKFDIAYNDVLGFLTSDTAIIGTGLKASVTLFLPALTICGKINEVLASVSSQGFSVNSFDDEIDYQAYTFQISNLNTIGKKETEIVVRLTELAIKIAEFEIKARKELLTFKFADDVKDKLYRAWGILTNCYKLSVEEAQKLLGELKMGVALDLLRFKTIDVLDNLMTDILPYSLTKISNSKVATAELDKYRATFVANVLKSKRIK